MNRLGKSEINELVRITEGTTKIMIELMEQPASCSGTEQNRTAHFVERLKIVKTVFDALSSNSIKTHLDLIAPYLREMRRAEKLCEMCWATEAWEEEKERQRQKRIRASRITIANLKSLVTTNQIDHTESHYYNEYDDGKMRLEQMSQRISQTKLKTLPQDPDVLKQ